MDTRAGTFVLLITSPLNILLNYIFIYRIGLRIYGAPVATGISYWVSVLLLVAYAAFVRGGEGWGGFAPRQAFNTVALFQIADGFNGGCSGALRGMGRQWVGAAVNIVSYLVVHYLQIFTLPGMAGIGRFVGRSMHP